LGNTTLPKTINQWRMYKDIMTSIGLDNPNNSIESRREENREHNQVTPLVNTPIRNNASSLIDLGQHVLNLRQGRPWNEDINSR
jgi:hypothetical protein